MRFFDADVDVAGTNVMEDEFCEESKHWRRVVRIGITGGNDEHADPQQGQSRLYYGDRLVGTFYSTVGTASFPKDDNMIPISSTMVCRPGEKIRLVVETALTTTDGYIVMDIQEIPKRRRWR